MKHLAFSLIILVFSCQPAEKKEEEVDLKALRNEVFEIHDEAMPKMGELRSVRKAIMLQADSLQQIDSLRANELIAISDRIAEANESMMAWMRNFNPEFEGTDEELLEYLLEQKEAITKVRDDMMGSLEAGEVALSTQ